MKITDEMINSDGWFGFSFFGTLCSSDGKNTPLDIPVDFARRLHKIGKTVKVILPKDIDDATGVSAWCMNNLGFTPELVLTNELDGMQKFISHDAIQVFKNDGIATEDMYELANKAFDTMVTKNKELLDENRTLFEKKVERTSMFCLGLATAIFFYLAFGIAMEFFRDKTPKETAIEHLEQAISEVRETL